MAQITRLNLSGSTNGRRVKVAASATPGTVIHTAHATALDECYLNAHNSAATSVTLTIEFGGVATPDDVIEVTVPPKSGLMQVIAGDAVSGSLVVRAFASTANVVTLGGYVLRIA